MPSPRSSRRRARAIAGSKFEAVDARDRNFAGAKTKRRPEQIDERIDESIARYLSQRDTADRRGPAVPEAKTTRLKEKIATLREEIERLNARNARMMASEDKQISLSDPDARAMAASGKGSGIAGYNVQSAVDAAHRLVVAREAANAGTDRSQLSNMAEQARTEIGTAPLDVVADRGYCDGQEIPARRYRPGYRPARRPASRSRSPPPPTSSAKAADRFGKQDFVYVAAGCGGLRRVAAEDVYRCPAGERSISRHTNEEDGKTLRRT